MSCKNMIFVYFFFFFQAEDGIRDWSVTGVQTCALPILAVALANTTGIDIGLWREGIASLAFEEAEAERLRDAVAHQRQAGLRCDWLEPAEVAERFPATAPCLGAMFAPEDGAVDAPALARALRADAHRGGAHTLDARVT